MASKFPTFEKFVRIFSNRLKFYTPAMNSAYNLRFWICVMVLPSVLLANDPPKEDSFWAGPGPGITCFVVIWTVFTLYRLCCWSWENCRASSFRLPSFPRLHLPSPPRLSSSSRLPSPPLLPLSTQLPLPSKLLSSVRLPSLSRLPSPNSSLDPPPSYDALFENKFTG